MTHLGKTLTFILFIGLLSVTIVAQNSYPEIELLRSDETGIHFRFNTPEYKLKETEINGKVFTKVDFSDLEYSSKAGFPNVPLKTILIAIPPAGNYTLNIINEEVSTIRNISIPPVLTYKRKSEGFPVFEQVENKEIYNSDKPYPENFIIQENPGYMGNLRVLKFAICPLRFYPAEKKADILKYLTVKIDFNGQNISGKTEKNNSDYRYILNSNMVSAFEISGQRKTQALKKTEFEGDWYKIEIDNEGIYRINESWFSNNGIGISSVDPGTIKIFNNGGMELPASIDAPCYTEFIENQIYLHGGEDGSFDQSDYILFYARGTDGWKWDENYSEKKHYINHYTDKNVYWLNIGSSGRGKRMTETPYLNNPNAFALSSCVERFYREEEKFNLFGSGLEWLNSQFVSDGFSKDYEFNISNMIPGTPANLLIKLKGGSEDNHYFKIEVNENIVASNINLSWFSNLVKEYPVQQYINEGKNKLTLSYSSSEPEGTAYLDWFEVHYQRSLTALDNILKFESPMGFSGIGQYNLTGFSNPSNVMVFDITWNDSVNILNTETESNIVKIQDSPEPGKIKTYLAVDRNEITTCPNPVKVNPAGLTGISEGAEFVIIAYDAFADACIPLKNLRESSSSEPLSTRIFKLSDIYNEFSFGLKDPMAIRNFLKFAYENWDTRPGYALLVGDGHYDYKNNLGDSPPIYIPPFEIDGYNELQSRATDDWYTYLVGNDHLMDIAVGRITSNSVEETEKIIDKIVQYETDPEFGMWKSRITLVADDEFGNAGSNDEDMHTDDSEDLAEHFIPDIFNVNKIYLMEYEGTQSSSSFHLEKLDAAEDLIEMINEGCLVINYFGHGTPFRWAHEKLLLHERDFTLIKNGRKIPIWVVATCDFGHYDAPEFRSMSEELLSKNEGGGIAILSTNRGAFASSNAAFTKKLFDNLFNENGTTIRIGDAVKYSKNSTTSLTNNQKFHIFGDPALKIAVPYMRPVNISLTPDTMKAIGKSTINVHTGNLVSGNSQVFVYNSSIKRIHTMPNDYPVEYYMPGGIIFRGISGINNSTFNSDFIVPKDITYGGTDGRINVYFYNDQTDGMGYIDNIYIGGTTEGINDTDGPVIEIYYDEDRFLPGGIAKKSGQLKIVLHDENGINLTGEIGHSITATIDENQSSRKILNNYFYYDENSYQRGSTYFSLEDLSSGNHSLTIKAWDNLNNSSSYSVDFEVIQGGALVIKDVFNYPNPFTADTYFTFRLSTPSEIRIKVYTQYGRLIKTIEGVLGTNGFNKVYWDGRDEDGDRPANGVYLYKIIAKDLNTDERTEEIGKLAVMR